MSKLWSPKYQPPESLMYRLAYILLGATGLGLFLAVAAPARDSYPPLDVLLSGAETVLGQTVAYPDGPPKITAAIVTMVPGQTTGPHHHEVPLFADCVEKLRFRA
ncbi:MAG: hypothetical protein GKR99_16625 [Rhodobacteraceae bacterium]|nr:hypothetical protein [Paracoccaceae bacterium]